MVNQEADKGKVLCSRCKEEIFCWIEPDGIYLCFVCYYRQSGYSERKQAEVKRDESTRSLFD
jgi:hypothetical protein